MCDDIFEEIDKDHEVNEREWQKSVHQINKAGYREGLDKGKEEVMQEGFNKAFSTSSQLVYEIAEMRGKISAKLSYNLMRKGILTDKQELDLQNLLQDVVLLESELLQCSKIPISDWIRDSSKVYSDYEDSDMRSRGPVCDSDQSDDLGTLKEERVPVNRTEVEAGGDNIYYDQTKILSDPSEELGTLKEERVPVNMTEVEAEGDNIYYDQTKNSSDPSEDMDIAKDNKMNQTFVKTKLSSWTMKLENVLLNMHS